MASANLDLVRSILVWEGGDFSSADWAHPDIQFVAADGPVADTWTGLAGLAAGWREALSGWDHFRFEAEEYRELDDERVLVLTHYSARGKTSGLEIGQVRAEEAAVFHIRDGKVTKLVGYWDRDRALADLAPEDGSAEPR